MSVFEGIYRTCRKCGCDDAHACYDPRLSGGCGWVEPDLCSMWRTEEQFQAYLKEFQALFEGLPVTMAWWYD